MKPEQIEEMKRDRVKSYHKHDWCLEGDFDESGKHPPHGYLSIAWTTEVPICELRFIAAFSEDLSREKRKQICAYARRIARVPTLEAEVLRLREALEECEEYFDNRADADCDQDGFIPNDEMKRLTTVRTALGKQS